MIAQPMEPAGAARSVSALDMLNAVALGPAQIAAALAVLGMLPDTAQRDPAAQALALQGLVRDAAAGAEVLVAAALHARVTALAKWTAAHDPERQSDAGAVLEATARYALCEADSGIGFEAAGFQEMILFLEELPW